VNASPVGERLNQEVMACCRVVSRSVARLHEVRRTTERFDNFILDEKTSAGVAAGAAGEIDAVA
jgi:hypothetical protein